MEKGGKKGGNRDVGRAEGLYVYGTTVEVAEVLTCKKKMGIQEMYLFASPTQSVHP